MPLTKYTNGTTTVLAGRITESAAHPMAAGAVKINFGDDFETVLRPQFVELHDPKAGDWFVINEDYSGATVMRSVEFEKRFKEAQ